MAAQALFIVIAAVALLGGLGVVAFRQPIHSVLSLVGTMLALAILFLLLSAQFVFVVQIIVYAGAVMVLFLFVVALLGPMRERWTHRLGRQWVAALAAAVAFFVLLLAMLQSVRFRTPQGGDMSIFGTVEHVAAGLFGPYLYPFELTSILLLVAAVGAIYLSRGGRGPRDVDQRRRAERPTSPRDGDMDRPERVEALRPYTTRNDDADAVAHKEERRA
jgi:NADH-quinone oxidoreductase subunit J